MSLARSLTSRMRERFEAAQQPSVPNRAFSTKAPTMTVKTDTAIDRRLISLPVELLSTSNSLAYEAPDIKNLIEPKANPTSPRSPSHPHQQTVHHQPLSPLVNKQQAHSPISVSSSASSTHSWDADGLASPALTSASSVTSNEYSREPSPASCDPNTTFFMDKDEPETPAAGTRPKTQEPKSATEPAPAIPARSSLHTKESHQSLARARSVSRQASTSGRRASPRHSAEKVEPPKFEETKLDAAPPKLPAPRTSTDFFGSKVSMDHPFGAELAKVSELAEEFATEVTVVDEEMQYLIDNGFRCFGATEYILEIQPLFHKAFPEPALPVIAEWI